MDGRLNQLVRRMFRGSSEASSSSSAERRRSGGQLQREREEGEETGGTMRSGSGVVTLELDVLDCAVCWQPLCPPAFQCAVGHLICSSCLAKLPNRKRCYTCFRKDNYNRCYSMEKVLGSMQVPCSNARYGCAVKTSYHQKQDHEATCPYELCFCPGSGCGFSRRSALLRHFLTDHGWPSTTCSYGASFDVAVKDDEEVRVLAGGDGHLFLTVTLMPASCVVFSVVCVRPRDAAEPKFRCFMCFGSSKNGSRTESEFQVPSTTFSGGVGMPEDCIMFSVPKFYLEEDSKISVIMQKTLA